MPFRFRKIFKIAPGFKLNLSKRGFSTSIGKAGASLNFGKRGIRPTVGLPGTGLSFTPTQSNASAGGKSNSMLVNIIVLVISFIVICCIAIFCLGVIFTDTGTSTSTPTAKAQNNLATFIAGTSSIAQTQTMIFAPPSSTPFPYETPTLFVVTFAPSFTPIPTDTPFILSSLEVPPDSNSQCVCSHDTYNCGDALAKICFQYCKSQGLGDIHNLDGDGNGLACENN